jgi:metal-responsive CopG/Arc/MetJ family transcriptional regulator
MPSDLVKKVDAKARRDDSDRSKTVRNILQKATA